MGQRRGLGGVPTPLVVLCARCMGNTLLLLRTPQKWQLDFLVFLYLLVPNLPQACRAVFLVPYSLFVSCCWRRWLSSCRHCSKASQVPAWLRSIQLNFVHHNMRSGIDQRIWKLSLPLLGTSRTPVWAPSGISKLSMKRVTVQP